MTGARAPWIATLFMSLGLGAGLSGGCGEGVRAGDGDVTIGDTIGVKGGILTLRGVTLALPSGAVNNDIWISVERIPAAMEGALTDKIQIKPDSLTLDRPAMLTLSYVPPSGRTASDVTLGVLVGASWRPVTGAQLTGDNKVSAPIVQFSTYAPVATCGNNDQCSTGRCDSGVCQY